MVERDDMPGMAADSCSLRNVSVAIGNRWAAWKYCVTMPFECVVNARLGHICYCLSLKTFAVLNLITRWDMWLTFRCLQKRIKN